MTVDQVLDGVRTRPDGCWDGPGWLDKGYRRVRLNGRIVKVHRLVYEQLREPVPDGLVLDHLCRNRACCNPDHLEPVTNRENVLRGISPAAVRAKQAHCIHGHPLEYVVFSGRRRRFCRVCDRRRKLKPPRTEEPAR